MLRRALLTACAALAALCPAASAADHVPGEVIVRYHAGTSAHARTAVERAAGLERPRAFAARSRVLRVRAGDSVAAAVARLRDRRDVASAAPNYVARAAYVPNDPGSGIVPGGWQAVQWNFAPRTGVDAPGAWDHAAQAGRPGGAGVVVAVLDTGVAYRTSGRYVRSPDFSADQFRRGYDFVDEDPHPDDENGHGTHVASTIAERVDNGIGVTGLAYGARIMPVRVLNAHGEGDIPAIARGIRFAARHGADVINLSFEFGGALQAADIPEILSALRFAAGRGVLVVGAAGNAGSTALPYPARAREVLSVGAITERGCMARYSNHGAGLDLVAPGGGRDARVPGDANCRPELGAGRDIRQMTFIEGLRRFGLPAGYVGTSMAAPHVSATAALVIAAGVLGAAPAPAAIEAHLRATARDLGPRGRDRHYGAGALDAAAATAPLA
ncbi:MAG TPA: S8 family serine peptidase [Solirubrobacteraceae bacterium]|nr:S8 family serine peptidase [Solirubrobacteraceae bacterium]